MTFQKLNAIYWWSRLVEYISMYNSAAVLFQKTQRTFGLYTSGNNAQFSMMCHCDNFRANRSIFWIINDITHRCPIYLQFEKQTSNSA
jgi:hypothetical protein